MGLLGILVGLGALIWLSFRGWSILVLAPAAALIAALAAGEPLLAHWTQTFMISASGFLAQFFPLFLLGAVFGKLMDDSGSVSTIARFMTEWLGPRRAMLAVVLAGALVTYGGVSLFVAFFVIGPMAQALFRAADIPNRLMPAAIALGTSTFTMSALPGTPAIQNAIPMPFFGTTPFAAPVFGTFAALIMFFGGVYWLRFRIARSGARGEGYGTHPRVSADSDLAQDASLPSFAVAIAPTVLVIVLNAVLTYLIIPNLDTSYLAEARYGETDVTKVRGIWAIIVALVASILLLIVLNRSRLQHLKDSINTGTMGSLLPVFNTSSEVGYGAVIASLPAFAVVRDAVLNVSSNPLISVAVATNVLAGITGSASGGMSIALQTLGEQFNQLAIENGISPGLMHRVTALSSGGFDALPHNGAVITLLAICGLTHRESYFDIFICAVLIPVFATICVIVLGSMVY